jgi:putative acetyltransferase
MQFCQRFPLLCRFAAEERTIPFSSDELKAHPFGKRCLDDLPLFRRGREEVFPETPMWRIVYPYDSPLVMTCVACGRVLTMAGDGARSIVMAAQNSEIRNYDLRDAPEIVRLFFETVRSVNRADYSEEQLRAWAPSVPDPDEWHSRMADRRTLVAEQAGEVVGFAELEDDGHLAMLYVRGDAVGQGVGRRLYEAVEREARAQSLGRIFTEASITARPFFKRRGFRVVREQRVSRRGVSLTNFAMEKDLTG